MDELKAGLELDQLVAEKVMGWRRVPQIAETPCYSTSIAAAWRVIDRMAVLGYHARIDTPFTPGDPYWVGFTTHGCSGWNGRPDHQDKGETVGEAACKAALAAVGAVETQYGGLAPGWFGGEDSAPPA